MFIPKLHIKYAYPLDNDRRELFIERNFGYYPSMKEVEKKVEDWKKVWEKLNTDGRIFKLLTKITGVTLSRDLELYIFGGGLNAMSNPLIMPIISRDKKIFSDDQFSEIIIHEIAHRFAGNLENNFGIEKYWKSIRKEYKSETILTQNHIIIYAVLKLVLIEIFGKDCLKDFMYPKHPDYERAVTIVSEKGAEKLVEQFRSYLV